MKKETESNDFPTHTSSGRGPFPSPLARGIVPLHSSILGLTSIQNWKMREEKNLGILSPLWVILQVLALLSNLPVIANMFRVIVTDKIDRI